MVAIQAQKLVEDMDKEYLGITGLPTFTKAAAELAFGPGNPVLEDKRVSYSLVCRNRYLENVVSTISSLKITFNRSIPKLKISITWLLQLIASSVFVEKFMHYAAHHCIYLESIATTA